MEFKVAFLRGINVGGHKKFIKSEQLRMMESLGLSNIFVYLHTGNWVFTDSRDNEAIANKIEAAITETYGWEVVVLVLGSSEIEKIFNMCPFPDNIKPSTYFGFLKTVPTSENRNALAACSLPHEQIVPSKKCVYFYPEKGAGKAKMGNNFFEKKLQVSATTRNFNTVKKILNRVLA